MSPLHLLHLLRLYLIDREIDGEIDREIDGEIDGEVEAIAYGIPLMANADLVARFKPCAPLNEPDQNIFLHP